MNNTSRMRLFVVTLFLLAFAQSLAAAEDLKVIKLAITNSSELARPSENIVIQIAELQAIARDLQPQSVMVVASNASTLSEDAQAKETIELPSQVDDLDGDQKPDELVFQIGLQPKQTRIVTIAFGDPTAIAKVRSSYSSRANAKFTSKYEGLGWESDINAWRLYFDKRNAIDLFGKRHPGLSLETFGTPGHNYHEESPFGRDIYKIGNALGIGAIGALVDGKVVKVAEVSDRSWKIISSGPVRAIAELMYKGWQVGGRSIDLTSRITVWAGERGFDHRITASNANGLTFVTGLPRKAGLTETIGSEAGSRVVATWGHQVLMTGATATESLPDQNLGLVVILPAQANSPTPPDPDNLLTTVSLKGDTAHWYVAAAWDQEGSSMQTSSASLKNSDPSLISTKGITTRDEFVTYVKNLSLGLSSPATVRILSKTAASSRRFKP